MVKKVIFDMVMGIEVKKEKVVEKTTSAGLIIPSSAEDDSPEVQVKVIKIGNKVEEIEVGDMVLLQPYGNNKVVIKGQEVIIFRESVAICVLED